MDLSKQAAEEIGLTKEKGNPPVKIEAVVPPRGEPGTTEVLDEAKDKEPKG
jgi:rare lipoprotein A (peptidoglycan hydrolase)